MTHTAADAIDELIEVTSWLTSNLLPGTTKPFQAPEASPEKRAERARKARADRIPTGYGLGVQIPLGESPAPMDLDVMDLLVDILELAAQHSDLPDPTSAFDNPMPHLQRIRIRIRTGLISDGQILVTIERTADGYTERAHQKLGLFSDGQVLKVVCPWCAGRTGSHPEGGERTMRVKAVLPPGKKTMRGVDPTDVRWVVICESGTCDPPVDDYKIAWRGKPAWDLRHEGEFLARRFEAAAEAS